MVTEVWRMVPGAAASVTLERNGYAVRVFRRLPGFVEAEVRLGEQAVLLQWTRDSAYRFYPLVTHPEFGLTLHPFDLATSKVLALVGRVEPRDFDALLYHAGSIRGASPSLVQARSRRVAHACSATSPVTSTRRGAPCLHLRIQQAPIDHDRTG